MKTVTANLANLANISKTREKMWAEFFHRVIDDVNSKRTDPVVCEGTQPNIASFICKEHAQAVADALSDGGGIVRPVLPHVNTSTANYRIVWLVCVE